MGSFCFMPARRHAAFLNRARYLPEEWMTNRVRNREAGIPDEVPSATDDYGFNYVVLDFCTPLLLGSCLLFLQRYLYVPKK